MEFDKVRKIEELVSDRKKFNEFIYTPLDVALKELEERTKDVGLKSLIEKSINTDLPQVLFDKKCAVVFRQLTTPNYEMRRFINLVDTTEDLTPLFWEYKKDKFTDNNEWKYHLAKLSFYGGRGKKGGEKISHVRVVDFNLFRGKMISEVNTLWNQSLVEFHHELFKAAFSGKEINPEFFDASDWFAMSGGNAKDYYENFLKIFVCHAVLFENFMLDEKEFEFTKDIFLPAFLGVIEKFGKKPLIIALEPTELESHKFWMCHPMETQAMVENKMNTI